MWQRSTRSVFAFLLALGLALPALAQNEEPEVQNRRVVTLGGDADEDEPPVVNEPNIVATIIYDEVAEEFVTVFLVMWQVGDVPSGSQTEVPVALGHKYGVIDETNGFIMFQPEVTTPLPTSALDARDPALTLFNDDAVIVGSGDADRIAAAGVLRDNLGQSFPFVLRTLEYGDEFTQIEELGFLEVDRVRLEQLNPLEGTNTPPSDDLYLFGRALKPGPNDIETGQLVLRFS